LLVVDTGVVLKAILAGDHQLVYLADPELVAPPLMWSEGRSALHEASWRDELDKPSADSARKALEECRVTPRAPTGLGAEASRIATELGWAKTYDAEFCALASLLDTRLVTADARLRSGASRLGFVIGPTEI
jgi:predicted nucleic acid-binding protein